MPVQGTTKIKKELKAINFPPEKIKEVAYMIEAVKIAKQKAAAGDIVLLSTACASFGIFKNNKERGNLFKQYVRQ